MAVQEHNWLVDFLDLDIEDDGTILDLLNSKTPILEVINQDHGNLLNAIDLKGIYEFIKEWNEEYCTNHDLCPECRSQLVELFVDVPYGDTIVQESEGLRCPLCNA